MYITMRGSENVKLTNIYLNYHRFNSSTQNITEKRT